MLNEGSITVKQRSLLFTLDDAKDAKTRNKIDNFTPEEILNIFTKRNYHKDWCKGVLNLVGNILNNKPTYTYSDILIRLNKTKVWGGTKNIFLEVLEDFGIEETKPGKYVISELLKYPFLPKEVLSKIKRIEDPEQKEKTLQAMIKLYK